MFHHNSPLQLIHDNYKALLTTFFIFFYRIIIFNCYKFFLSVEKKNKIN